MNSGATSANKAAMARGAPKGCAKLDDANNETRSGLASKSKDKKIVGPDKNGAGTTVASSSFTPARGGRSINQTAHNNAKANNFSQNALAEGSGGKSKVKCPAASHKYLKGMEAQHAGHAEARMVDNVFTGRKPKGSMTINVDWIPSTDPQSKMPCENCLKLLCAAQKCGVDIYLCDKEGKKKKLQEGKHCPKDGPPGPQHHQALQKTMGEAK